MSTLAEPIPITGATQAADRRRRIIAIVGASSGNLVEWYDFYGRSAAGCSAGSRTRTAAAPRW